MIFSVDRESGELHHVPEEEFADLDVLEQRDFEEWAIRDPRVLGEELLIISNQCSNFDQTRDRLDILALDKDGKLVVVELKRDRADKTTDLQVIKYAGYCSTLIAEDVQKEYRGFWNRSENGSLTPEDVGETFADFLGERIEDIVTTDEGWAEFDLDDRPRILLVAGEFGIEVTAAGNVSGESDSDGDNLTDAEEAEYGTDPLDTDSDDDGWLDLSEVNRGCDPFDPRSHP